MNYECACDNYRVLCSFAYHNYYYYYYCGHIKAQRNDNIIIANIVIENN